MRIKLLYPVNKYLIAIEYKNMNNNACTITIGKIRNKRFPIGIA